MRFVEGAGCWPGKAEGTVVWMPDRTFDRTPVSDRAATALQFRAELRRALEDLETWSERQETVEARLILQTCRDALLEDAWSDRVCSLIDTEGTPAPAAAVEAALPVAAVLERNEALQEKAGALRKAARWFAGRLEPQPLPPDAILAAEAMTLLELLDAGCPVLLARPDALPVTGAGPVVWGVPELGPDWAGRHVAIDGPLVTLDVPVPVSGSRSRLWRLDGGTLNGMPVCVLNGHPDALDRTAKRLGRRPAALIWRLDDLAAVPLILESVSAVALDLDKLGPAPRLRHPGVVRLITAAVEAAGAAGVPIVAGGSPADRHPDRWLALGFTALYVTTVIRGGDRAHDPRKRQAGNL